MCKTEVKNYHLKQVLLSGSVRGTAKKYNLSRTVLTRRLREEGLVVPKKTSPEVIKRRIEACKLDDLEDSCWLWEGALDTRGYGCLKYEGRTQTAHRVSYKLFKGPIDRGHVIMHKCNTERCVNPEHLQAGTQKQNMVYAIELGRAPQLKRLDIQKS